MIVDAKSMDLVPAIEEMIEAVPRETEGAGEARADPVGARDLDRRVPQRRRGGRPARGAAPPGARDGRGEGPHDRLRRHPPVRALGGPAHRRSATATARSSTCSASSRGRSCCSGCTCTSASTTPRRRSTSRTGCGCTSRSCSRCRPTRPSGAGAPTGLMSSRTPIFRLLPRVGHPAPLRQLGASTARGSSSWSRRARCRTTRSCGGTCGPHPNLGTVEIRSCDAQTRLEHTVALTALIQAMCKELAEHYEAGYQLGTFPRELLEENKWLAARYGMQGELIDLPQSTRVPTAELARRLVERLRPHARELGSRARVRGARGPDRARHGRRPPARRVAREPRHGRARARDRRGDRGRRHRPRRRIAGTQAARPWRSLSGPMLSRSIVSPYLAWIAAELLEVRWPSAGQVRRHLLEVALEAGGRDQLQEARRLVARRSRTRAGCRAASRPARPARPPLPRRRSAPRPGPPARTSTRPRAGACASAPPARAAGSRARSARSGRRSPPRGARIDCRAAENRRGRRRLKQAQSPYGPPAFDV